MSSRRVQAWVWWLLPLLVARALMPVGFMAQLSDGQVQIVLCSGSQYIAKHVNHAIDKDGSALSTQQQTQDTHNDFSCPFTQLAAAPMLEMAGSEAIAFIAGSEISIAYESPYYAAGPPRIDSARGPPRSA
ncbi:MAG: hypothetical protein QM808_16410 [Steroidobacteraceae bacterium]